MFRLLLRHELKIALRTWPARVAWIVMLIATICAVADGLDRVRREQAAEAEFRNFEQARQEGFRAKVADIERQIAAGAPESAFPRVSSTFRERNPVVVGGPFAKGRRSAILPPAPLAALAVGQSDLLPVSIAMTTGSHSRLPRHESNASPVRMAVGYFDLAFVVIYLLPICLIALCFDLISGEREQGTLALLRSYPVSLGALLGAKCLVRALPLILVPSAGLLAICLTANAAMAEVAPLAMLGTLAILGYGSFWVMLAIAANTAGGSSAFNATGLAVAWLLIVVAVPAAGGLAAGKLHPTPSRIGYIDQLRGLERSLSESNAAPMLARYLTRHPELAGFRELAPVPRYYAMEAARGEALDEALTPSQRQFAVAVSAQRAHLNAWAVLSPAVALHDVLTTLSGTDGTRHDDFDTQSRRYHRTWKEFFMPLILADAVFTADDFDRIPLFQYREPDLRTVLSSAGLPIICLLASTALVTTVALRGSKHMSIFER